MKVSVVVPVYNVEKYITRCLDSLIGQTLYDIEIVVVDDCSPDNSMGIVEQYAQKDSRFTLVYNEKNMGLMWTRQVGYRNAKGDYIVFCDSDDYMPFNALELLYTAVTSTGADIVASAWVRRCPWGDTTVSYKLSYGTDATAVYESLLKKEFAHSLCAKIFSAKLFRDYKYTTFPHQTNGEDAILFYQIIEHVRHVEVIKESTYYYVFNGESSTMRIDNCKLKQIVFQMQYIYKLLKSHEEINSVLVATTIEDRACLWKYGKISLHELFAEEELLKALSWRILQESFSCIRALQIYILVHVTPCRSLYKLKYKLKSWLISMAGALCL